jgi:hypothetical protein
MEQKSSHFKGFSVIEHLKKAREKGKSASGNFHAVEVPGHISAGADSAKEVAVSSLLIQMIAHTLKIPANQIIILLSVYLLGILFWKVGRSAHLAWSRLERINQLVQEEKDEIEYNREEEREELTEMYRAKGFSEPLLTKIIDVLMADDKKLLAVMLEEELAIPMDAYVHPLKQAFGAGVGVLIAAAAVPIGLLLSYTYGLYFTTFIITAASSFLIAKMEKISKLENTVKGLSIAFLATFATYFFTKFLIQEIL